jgi:hypothetical protein
MTRNTLRLHMPLEQVSAAAARVDRGRFAPGRSGNPRGRPPGSRNGGGLAARLDKMVAVEAVRLVQGLLERAKAGDASAAAVLLARPWAGSEART